MLCKGLIKFKTFLIFTMLKINTLWINFLIFCSISLFTVWWQNLDIPLCLVSYSLPHSSHTFYFYSILPRFNTLLYLNHLLIYAISVSTPFEIHKPFRIIYQLYISYDLSDDFLFLLNFLYYEEFSIWLYETFISFTVINSQTTHFLLPH
jgi:hypothetical protein